MRFVKTTANCKKNSKRFRVNRLTVTIAALLLAACAHAQTAQRAVRTAPPLPSAPPWAAASKAELQRAIAQALAPAKAANYDWSCIVLAQDGSQLYDDRGANAVIPASAQKIVVANTMLARFE